MKDKIEVKLCQYFDEHWYKITYEKDKKEIVDYYPSTTTKLSVISKPGLTRWYGDIGTREALKRTKDTSDRGSRIHNAVEVFLKGGVVIYQPHYGPRIVPNYSKEEIAEISKKYHGIVSILTEQDEMLDVWKVQKLFEILKPETFGIELIVWSHENREAGTIDMVLKLDEGIYEGINRKKLELAEGYYICDLKTGGIYDEAYMQLASYSAMFKERYPKLEIMGGLIIHTGSSTKSGIPGLSLIYREKKAMIEDYRDFRAVAQMWERQNKNAMPRLLEFPSIIANDI